MFHIVRGGDFGGDLLRGTLATRELIYQSIPSWRRWEERGPVGRGGAGVWTEGCTLFCSPCAPRFPAAVGRHLVPPCPSSFCFSLGGSGPQTETMSLKPCFPLSCECWIFCLRNKKVRQPVNDNVNKNGVYKKEYLSKNVSPLCLPTVIAFIP